MPHPHTDVHPGHPARAFAAGAEAGEGSARATDPGDRIDQKSVLYRLHRFVIPATAFTK